MARPKKNAVKTAERKENIAAEPAQEEGKAATAVAAEEAAAPVQEPTTQDTPPAQESTTQKTTLPPASEESGAPTQERQSDADSEEKSGEANGEPLYTEEEVQARIEQAKAEEAKTVNMVVEQKAPPVKILYIDSCIPNNQVPIGNNRYITGSGRIFAVPLEQFEGEFMTPLVMKLIDNRKFVVLSGLTNEQRMQYNCYYGDGEVIKNEGVFDSLLKLPVEKAVAIFAELCPEHRQLVATRFMGAYFERHDNRVSRERVEALNAVSKRDGGEGLFTPIVKDINEKI